jgi:hypothetical protein
MMGTHFWGSMEGFSCIVIQYSDMSVCHADIQSTVNPKNYQYFKYMDKVIFEKHQWTDINDMLQDILAPNLVAKSIQHSLPVQHRSSIGLSRFIAAPSSIRNSRTSSGANGF